MDKWLLCVVALILGMLMFHMMKSVCGCKTVEGQYLVRYWGGRPAMKRADEAPYERWTYPYSRASLLPDRQHCLHTTPPTNIDRDKYIFENSPNFWQNTGSGFDSSRYLSHQGDQVSRGDLNINNGPILQNNYPGTNKCWGQYTDACTDYVNTLDRQIGIRMADTQSRSVAQYGLSVNTDDISEIEAGRRDRPDGWITKWKHLCQQPSLSLNQHSPYPVETCADAGLSSDQQCAAAAEELTEGDADKNKIFSNDMDEMCPGGSPENGMYYDYNLRKCKHTDCCKGPQKCSESFWNDEGTCSTSGANPNLSQQDVASDGTSNIECITDTCTQDECCRAPEQCNCLDPSDLRGDALQGCGENPLYPNFDDYCDRVEHACNTNLLPFGEIGCYTSHRGEGNCGDWMKIGMDGKIVTGSLQSNEQKYQNENECLLHKYNPHSYHTNKHLNNNIDAYNAALALSTRRDGDNGESWNQIIQEAEMVGYRELNNECNIATQQEFDGVDDGVNDVSIPFIGQGASRTVNSNVCQEASEAISQFEEEATALALPDAVIFPEPDSSSE